MAVGDRIRLRREEKSMTAADLARMAGVTKGYLSQIETGQVPKPSGEVLYNLATVLGTTVADLLEKEIMPNTLNIPDALKTFAEQEHLPNSDIDMLAMIKFRGRQPETVDDWRFLYESIKRTIAD